MEIDNSLFQDEEILFNFEKYFAIYHHTGNQAKFIDAKQHAAIARLWKVSKVGGTRQVEDYLIPLIKNGWITKHCARKRKSKRNIDHLLLTAKQLNTPIFAFIELTGCCDFNCTFCYLKKARKERFSLENYIRVLEQLYKRHIRIIVLTGGEPLLHEDIEDIIRETLRKRVALNLQTNGHNFSTEVVRLLAANRNRCEVQISFHSIEEKEFDKITGRKGSFRNVLENIMLLEKNGIDPYLKLTITKENMQNAEKTINWFKRQGYRYKINDLILPMLYDVNSIKYLPNDTRYIIMRLIDSGEIAPPERSQCSALKTKIRIEANGNLVPCELYRKNFGNLLTGSYHTILESSEVKTFQESDFFSIPEECHACQYETSCTHCPARSLLENKKPNLKSDYTCSYTKSHFTLP